MGPAPCARGRTARGCEHREIAVARTLPPVNWSKGHAQGKIARPTGSSERDAAAATRSLCGPRRARLDVPSPRLPTPFQHPAEHDRRHRWGATIVASDQTQKDSCMANKMLTDATHPEETRVVVVRGNRVEEFDFESASRRQLKGNIYLAKVTRVEPSLQAAFVDYGGNRHGFLAFSEIHPDYYQIPVADRLALIEEEERAHRDAEAEADRRADMRRRPSRRRAAAGRHAETVSSEPVADDLAEHDAPTEHDAEPAPHEHEH